jgi:uncharacterized membrane protein YgcG
MLSVVDRSRPPTPAELRCGKAVAAGMKPIFLAVAMTVAAISAPALAQTATAPGSVAIGYPSGSGVVFLPSLGSNSAFGSTVATTTTISGATTTGGSAGGGSSGLSGGSTSGTGGSSSGAGASGSANVAAGSQSGSVEVLCPGSGALSDAPFMFGTDLSCAP